MDGLDLKKILEGKTVRFVSSEEALKDIIPIDWDEDVLSGKVKIIAKPDSGRPTGWDAE